MKYSTSKERKEEGYLIENINLLLLLNSIFVACIVIADLIGSSMVLIFGFTVSAATFVVPFIYLVIDTTTEVFGKNITKKMIYIGFLAQIFTAIIVWAGGLPESSPYRDLHEAYQAMFGLTPRMVLASMSAYFISTKVNINIFHSLTQLKYKIPFWLRSQVSSFVGQAIDVSVFSLVFLYGVIPNDTLFKVTLTYFWMKIIFLTLNTPMLILVKALLKQTKQTKG